MNPILIVLLIIVILILIFVFTYIVIYNKIQKNKIRINEAESEIDETLRKRFDILKKLEQVINKNTNLKQDNFKEFEDENLKISNFEMDRKLTKIADTFNKIKSDYPDDLDTEECRSLMINLKINEEKNEASKEYYNKFTTNLNTLITKFPSNIIARIHKVEERNYFDNKNMFDDDIFDFKL